MKPLHIKKGNKVEILSQLNSIGTIVKINESSQYADVNTDEGLVCYPWELLGPLNSK